MTARLRAALETIASGTGPIGGRLGYEQMREIARTALKADQMEAAGYDVFTPPSAEVGKPAISYDAYVAEKRDLLVQRWGDEGAEQALAWVKRTWWPDPTATSELPMAGKCAAGYIVDDLL